MVGAGTIAQVDTTLPRSLTGRRADRSERWTIADFVRSARRTIDRAADEALRIPLPRVTNYPY